MYGLEGCRTVVGDSAVVFLWLALEGMSDLCGVMIAFRGFMITLSGL